MARSSKNLLRGAESALGIFSDLHLSWTFLLLLTFLNINRKSILHTNICLTTGIPQQCLSCRLNVLVNFGQIFALFLGTFIVDFENYLFIVNVSLWHLCGKPKRDYIYGSICKTLVFQLCQWLALWDVLKRYLSISCYDTNVKRSDCVSSAYPQSFFKRSLNRG